MSALTTEAIGVAVVKVLVAQKRSEAWLAQCKRIPRGLCGTMMEMLALLLPEERAMGALARELRVTTAAMTGLADRAERLGLVSRRLVKVDRRVVMLGLTEAGQKLVVEIFTGKEAA